MVKSVVSQTKSYSVYLQRFSFDSDTGSPDSLFLKIWRFFYLKMMKMKDKIAHFSPINGVTRSEWEVRPGGMLVQTRKPDLGTTPPLPSIRVRVKYGSIYHEISISSQATFGELKKMLTGPTGLHHQDQKLMYKDKERESKVFLDIAGVKDRSKIVLVEDPISHEKRILEARKNAKMEKASKSISEISLEIDRFAGQVSAYESIIAKGGKVVEKEMSSVIELLMNQLLKLDGIIADGDAKVQRKLQVERVQKYVETLDMLKMKNNSISNGGQTQMQNVNNSMTNSSNGGQMPSGKQQRYSNGHRLAPIEEQSLRQYNGEIEEEYSNGHHHDQHVVTKRQSASKPVVVTTKWEIFDSTPALIVPSTSNSVTNNLITWESFD